VDAVGRLQERAHERDVGDGAQAGARRRGVRAELLVGEARDLT
jgi:hypothetical protein